MVAATTFAEATVVKKNAKVAKIISRVERAVRGLTQTSSRRLTAANKVLYNYARGE